VTHDQEEAMTVSTRIAVMDQGVIRQIATPTALYEQPNSRYVADFIGDVNLIQGTWIDGSVVWSHDQAPFDADGTAGQGETVWLSLRPEKIGISKTQPNAANAVPGTVIDIAYLGNLSTYIVEIPGGQKIKAQAANARRVAHRYITWNDTVWLSWSKTAGVVLTK
ncbi:MAG: ABC transporter ATP-binding protein, partial [Pseudomonadota bacterium]